MTCQPASSTLRNPPDYELPPSRPTASLLNTAPTRVPPTYGWANGSSAAPASPICCHCGRTGAADGGLRQRRSQWSLGGGPLGHRGGPRGQEAFSFRGAGPRRFHGPRSRENIQGSPRFGSSRSSRSPWNSREAFWGRKKQRELPFAGRDRRGCGSACRQRRRGRHVVPHGLKRRCGYLTRYPSSERSTLQASEDRRRTLSRHQSPRMKQAARSCP